MAHNEIVKEVLEKYGQLFSEEIGIHLKEGTPSALFQWLFSSTMFSARIGSDISVSASRALLDKGWTTPEKMKNTSWKQRVKVLNSAHYTRYQEKTATYLGEISEKLIENYQGNLNKLKDVAGDDLNKLRRLLKEFKGMGDVGVDIFLREAQITWENIYPFADKKALQAASNVGLPKEVNKLSKLVNKKDFPNLLAALVRAALNNDYKLEKEPDSKNLESQSKENLYNEAKKKNIKGRSGMNKKELIYALEKV